MGLFDSFRKEEVAGTKVLACTLDAKFAQQLNSDSQTYKRYYPATTATTYAGLQGLTQGLKQPCDILHFLGDLSPEGVIVDSGGKTISAAQLIDSCCDANVKLLWMASDNKAENYNKAFNVQGKKLNVIMTVRRLGPYFSLFLSNLLEKMSAGEPVGKAWHDLNPQGGDSVQPDTPECIFVGGRKVVLKK